jgi:hypothetical protein
MVSIEESKIIDREAEAMIFKDMLRFKTPRRILVVSGQSGMGKSDLLRKLRFMCENECGIPVALRDLRELESRPDVFPLVVSLHKALTDGGAAFPTFDTRNRARIDHNRSALGEPQESGTGMVNATGAQIEDSAKVAGKMTVVERAEHVYMGQPQWTEEHETAARSRCIDGFLGDLLAFCREQPAVMLFDSVDKAGEDVQRWIFLDLIRRRLLPALGELKLLVVLAGIDAAEMLSSRLQPAERECVEPIASLSRWDEETVAAFLAAHNYGGFSKDEISAIHTLLSAGYTLFEALMVAATMAQRSRP